MKKYIIITIFMLVAFAYGGWAQSQWHSPWPGSSHTYTAAVTDPESDNPVRWWVATNPDGTGKAVHGTDYTFVTAGYNAAEDRLEGVAVYAVAIDWGTGLADGDGFYIVIEVLDGGTLACANLMALPVQVNTGFNAYVYDVTGSAIPGTVIPGSPGDDTEDPTCPAPPVNPVWSGTGHTDIGNSQLVFRVGRQLSLLGWQFEFEITEASSQSFSIDSIRFVDESATVLPVSNQPASLVSGEVGVGSSEDWVLAYVYVRNQMGVTLQLNFDLITTNNLTRDLANNYDGDSSDNQADHTIQPMPVITNFTGN
jgi:hypothetical protein